MLKLEEQRFIDELYDRYYDGLFKYASRFLDPAGAEDAVQSVFLDACTKIGELTGHEDPGGWLFNAVRFSVGKTLRGKRYAAENTVYVPTQADPAAGLRFGIEDLPDKRPPDEDVDILYGDLAAREEFQLVKQFAVDDKSVRDIAREYGISEGACRTRLFRARKKLRLFWKK